MGLFYDDLIQSDCCVHPSNISVIAEIRNRQKTINMSCIWTVRSERYRTLETVIMRKQAVPGECTATLLVMLVMENFTIFF